MNLEILLDKKTLITVASTMLITTGSLWALRDTAAKPFCPNTQTQTGSFGITIQGYRGSIVGGEKDNSIDGGRGGEDIVGGGGNDKIRAFDGDDFVDGEFGEDVLEAGLGRDIVLGDSGNDTIIGIDSFEFIDGGDGEDTLIIPYSCRKFSLTDLGKQTKIFRSRCGVDRVKIKNVENFIVEPAPMQGPPAPQRKLMIPSHRRQLF
jgi:RTX calcium-binding nonapeptide repeat (4 copies)